MAEETTQVSITPARKVERSGFASALGESAAAVLSHLIDVIDREDRLESGSGRFRLELAANEKSGRAAVEQAVLRALGMAADPLNYRLLEVLAGTGPASTNDLSAQLGLPRLAVEERISDLVSAGLAAKVFSSGQVAGTATGAALVALIHEAATIGSKGLEKE